MKLQFIVYISSFLAQLFIINSCGRLKTTSIPGVEIQMKNSIYTEPSSLENNYIQFHSPNAINTIATIENDYFNQYETGLSTYYGTMWSDYASSVFDTTSDSTLLDHYQKEVTSLKDSMHCTIYAVRALEAGFGDNFDSLDRQHQAIWNDREYAGWSIGYLLVKHWNWKAFLIIDPSSREFNHCLKSYQKEKTYPVWKQPNIPLEAFYKLGTSEDTIQQLLLDNEFGWGFSYQGYHTWITRFNELKECNWNGAPSKAMALSNLPLFLSTPFLDYHDYKSHVLVFPPK